MAFRRVRVCEVREVLSDEIERRDQSAGELPARTAELEPSMRIDVHELVVERHGKAADRLRQHLRPRNGSA